MSTGFLLDTVVVSELRKGAKTEAAVIGWQVSVGVTPVYLSVITLLEVHLSLRRVQAQNQPFAALFETWYHKRLFSPLHNSLLEVNLTVAEAVAKLPAGHTLSPHDALIPATARVHQLTLVTRNVSDFIDTDVSVLNPCDF